MTGAFRWMSYEIGYDVVHYPNCATNLGINPRPTHAQVQYRRFTSHQQQACPGRFANLYTIMKIGTVLN